jgi:hypothetical protein
MRLKKMAFAASPVAAAAAAGGLSWFLGGAMADMAPVYGGAAAAGALVGALLLLPGLRAAEKELAAARADEARKVRAAQVEARLAPAREDVRELRDLVASLGRLLKTAEEAEAARSAELERASREARRELSEAERLLEAAGRALSAAARALAAAEEGGGGGQDRGD